MFIHFVVYCLICLITKLLTKLVIREFSAAFEELKCCELPIKIGWFCPETTAGVRCIEKPDDVKEYIKGALKKPIGGGHTFIMAPYIEK